MNYFTRDFTNLKLYVCSSQEPDAKRQRVDDSSSGAAGTMADTQANNSAYNYNWYQVGFVSEQLMALKTVSYVTPSIYGHLQHLLWQGADKTTPKLNSCFVCWKLSQLFSLSLLFSNNTAVGDKTPGGSTTNMLSITSTIPLLQHDGQNPDMKMETQRKASFLTCLHLWTGLLNWVSWRRQSNHRSSFVPSFWFKVC